MIFAWFALKETNGNTEMENRLLYSPDRLRKEREVNTTLDKSKAEETEAISSIINYDGDGVEKN